MIMYYIYYFRRLQPVFVACFESPDHALDFVTLHHDKKYRIALYQSGHVTPVSFEELSDTVYALKVFNIDKSMRMVR